jgi:uncharacterized protein (TIGR02679 family)
MNERDTQLLSIFSAAGWMRFISKLRDYRDCGKPFPSVITLRNVSDEERRHHARLLRLGAPSRANSLRYDLVEILGALDHSANWEHIVTLVHGAIPDARLAAQAAEQAWQRFSSQAAEMIASNPFPECHEWFHALRKDGTLKRVSRSYAGLFDSAVNLLRSLPLAEEQPLASVAANYCRDSHALDPGTTLSNIILRGLALRQRRMMPARSDERRELWAEFGVVCDELSAPVLTFNLGVSGKSPLCELVSISTANIQPIHLTSRILWSADWKHIHCPPDVFVCENPTVVSLAANHLGIKCPPLICGNGEPRSSARLLIRYLRKSGTRVWYHGDFDWPGVAIANRVFEELGASPWLFDSDAYLQASQRQGRALLGKSVPTPWSPTLSEEMKRIGVAFDEELLADILIDDLARR